MAASSECARCGALLPSPDSEGRISCLGCGKVTRRRVRTPAALGSTASPTRAPTPRGPVPVPTPARHGPPGPAGSRPDGATARPTQGRGGCLLVILLVVAFVTPVGSWAVTTVRDAIDDLLAPGAEGLAVQGEVLVVDATGTPEVVAVAAQVDEGRRTLVRAAADGDVRWEHALGATDGPVRIGIVDDVVLVVRGTSVIAVELASGDQRWQSALVGGLADGCEPCIGEVGGRALLAGELGIRAVDLDDGAEAWSHGVVPGGARPVVAGDHVLAITPEAAGPTARVEVLDGADGEVLHELAPSCGGVEAHSSDLVAASVGDGSVLLVSGTGPTCVELVDPATTEARWDVEVDAVLGEGEVRWAGAGSHLVAVDDVTALRVDLAGETAEVLDVPGPLVGAPAVDGSQVALVADVPDEEVDGLTVVTFDLEEPGTRSQIATSSAQVPLLADPAGPGADVTDGRAHFALVPVRGHLQLLSVTDGAERTARLRTLSLDEAPLPRGDGTSLVGRSDGPAVGRVQVVGSVGTTVLLANDGVVQALDAVTGEVTASWAG